MTDALFFLKTALGTLLIVMVMQIQVGEKSIENHAMGWVQTSSIVSPLNGVAKGAAKLYSDVKTSIKESLVGSPTKSKDKKN